MLVSPVSRDLCCSQYWRPVLKCWLSQSQRFLKWCWAFRVDFLSLLRHHDDVCPNRAKHHCQAPLSSKTGLKFGCGEIHIFSWEPWLPCWELHLLNLEGLHYVLVAGLCFVLSNIFFCQCWRLSVKLQCLCVTFTECFGGVLCLVFLYQTCTWHPNLKQQNRRKKSCLRISEISCASV